MNQPHDSTQRVILRTVAWIAFFCFAIAVLVDWIKMDFGKGVILFAFFIIAALSSVTSTNPPASKGAK